MRASVRLEMVMQMDCPHCKKRFDVSIKTVLDWIGSSKKLRAAVKSLIAKLNRAESPPESQRRDVDYAELARKSHEKRRENAAKNAEKLPL